MYCIYTWHKVDLIFFSKGRIKIINIIVINSIKKTINLKQGKNRIFSSIFKTINTIFN